MNACKPIDTPTNRNKFNGLRTEPLTTAGLTGDRWVGIPWVADGHSFAGCSCWGLVRLYYREVLDVSLPDVHHVDQMAGRWFSVKTAIPGDVLLFHTAGGPHVGLAIGGPDMLHVDKCEYSRIERFTGLKWAKRLRKIYRHKA